VRAMQLAFILFSNVKRMAANKKGINDVT